MTEKVLSSLDPNIILLMFIISSLFLVFLIFFLLTRSQNKFQNYLNQKNIEDQKHLQSLVLGLHGKFNKEQFDFQSEFKQNFFDSFYSLNENLSLKLNEGVEKSHKSYTSIVERLSKIDEAQKNIQNLSRNVGKLENILTDKKTRGIFGEIQLNQILSNVFGDSDLNYSLQHKLSNSTIVDCFIRLPEPMGALCIDSKFPLEAFQKIEKIERGSKQLIEFQRQFKRDIKKHIDDIHSKYIIEGETANQAILFLPAEAIFAEIYANFPELVSYSYEKSVWIASPTTLMAILTTAQVVLKNFKQQESVHLIQNELRLLSKDFEMYDQRWLKLNRAIETLSKSANDISITSGKIKKRFHEINEVKLNSKRELS